MKRIRLLIIILTISIIIITFVFISNKIIITPENQNNDCFEILNKIRNNNPEELERLYDDVVIKEMHKSPFLYSPCDFGPLEITEECMKNQRNYKEKLDCVNDFIKETNVSKKEFLKIEVFN